MRHLALISAAIGCFAPCAHAARPMAVDDTGVNDPGTCQVEVWQEHEAGDRHLHVAPTCGVWPGLEINLETIHSRPSSEHAQGAFAGFRWAPSAWQFEHWSLALRGGWLKEKAPAGGAWSSVDWSLGLMAARSLNDSVTLLLNLGHTHQLESSRPLTTHGLGLLWTPNERWNLFVEALGEGRERPVLGMGARWWPWPGTLGLDATLTRPTTPGGRTIWGLGLGWYGIKF